MGCGPSNNDKIKKNKELENKMEKEARLEQEKIKLLLLGAGESGKRLITQLII